MKEVKKATVVGTTCIFTYIANYYLRHILSVLTPTLLLTGDFTVEHIANLSSTYMLLYAAGQLINGFLGDVFSPKNMVSIGLFVSGGSLVVFPFLDGEMLHIICFACFGFGLSMLRGPLMKIISENTCPSHARLICVFFSFSSFAGPLVASIFALIKGWNLAFIVAGAVAVVIGFLAHIIFSVMEARGVIDYIKTEVKGMSSILRFIADELFVKSATAPEGCYGKIYSMGGKVLLIGVAQNRNTYIHAIEEILGIPNRMAARPEKTAIRKLSGEAVERDLLLFDADFTEDVSWRFTKYDTPFRYHGCITDGFVGNAPAQLCDGVKMKETVELIFRAAKGVDILKDEEPIPQEYYCNK